MPPTIVLDPTVLDELRSLDPAGADALVRELVQLFAQDTPPRLEEMEQALGRGDALAFGRAAHGIKGSAANLGATALQQAADEAERSGRAGHLAEGRQRLAAVREEFLRARDALELRVARGG